MNDETSSGGPHERASLFVLAVLLFLAPVAFWWGGSDPFEAIKSLLLTLGAIALVGVGLLALRRDWWGRLPYDSVTLAVLAGVASSAVATLASVAPSLSLLGAYESHGGLVTTVSLAVVYLAARLARPIQATRLAAALALACAVVTVYGLVQTVGLDPIRWQNRSDFAGWTRPISTLGHPMQLGGFLVAALPFVGWLAGRSSRPAARWALWVVFAAALVVLAAALARGAWLAGGAALGVWLLLRGRAALVRPALVMTAVLLIVTACVPAVRERATNLLASPERLAMWRGCWALVLDRPLTGHGPDTLQITFGARMPAEYWAMEWGRLPHRAHCEPLHLLVTQGVPGGIAFLVLLAALAWAGLRAWRERPDDRPLTAVLLASATAFQVQVLTGFALVGCAVPFAVVCGLLGRLASPDPKPAPEATGEAWPPIWKLAGVATLLFAAWHLVVRPGVAWHLTSAPGLASLPGEERVARLKEATGWAPERPEVWLALAKEAQAAAVAAENEDARRPMWRLAVRASAECCRLVPVSPDAHANHARVLLVATQGGLATREDVLAAYDRALAVWTTSPICLVEAAEACVHFDDHRRAEQYLERAEQCGHQHGSIQATRGALLLAQGQWRAAEVALSAAMQGKWHDDLTGLSRAQELLGLLYIRTRRFGPASQLAEAMVAMKPDHPVGYWVRAQASEGLEKRDRAMADYRRVLELRPNHPPTLAALSRLQASK